MNNINDLLARIEQTDGMLNIKDVLREGFSKLVVDQLIIEGNLHKLTPNLYLTPEAAKDEMFLIRTYSNNAIFSHETALYLHHLGDSNISKQWVVTAPSGYSVIHLRAMGVKAHFMKKDLYKLGMVETKSTYGRTIYTYNAERTICDILRDKNEMPSAIIEEALTRYAAREDKDLEQLAFYARQFRIEGLIKSYSHLLLL
jgi:hypothetical protein